MEPVPGCSGMGENEWDYCTSALTSNDRCLDAVSISPGLHQGSTSYASPDNDEAEGCAANASPGVWYNVVGTGVEMNVNTCQNLQFDTILAVFNGACGSLTCIANNDDSGNCGQGSSVSWMSQVGVEYKILVFGRSGQSGPFTLHLAKLTSRVGVGPFSTMFHGIRAQADGLSDRHTQDAVASTTVGCQDGLGTFVVVVDEDRGERDCAWLAGQPSWKGRLCKPGFDPYEECKSTCGRCV
uniref:Uncharacterized protein n=1 Tax=Cyclophora tenuis TaxID=216820 RepID=A0A7S1GR83_CYCTE